MRWIVPMFLIITTSTALLAEDAVDIAEANSNGIGSPSSHVSLDYKDYLVSVAR